MPPAVPAGPLIESLPQATAGRPADPATNLPAGPASAQLGEDGVARLRARYASVLEAIARRVPDPERQTELKAAAERLNPDAWDTDEAVRAGLDQYESVLEGLRAVVGRRRRRRKSRRGGPDGAEGAGSAAADAAGGEDRQEDGHEGDPEPSRTD